MEEACTAHIGLTAVWTLEGCFHGGGAFGRRGPLAGMCNAKGAFGPLCTRGLLGCTVGLGLPLLIGGTACLCLPYEGHLSDVPLEALWAAVAEDQPSHLVLEHLDAEPLLLVEASGLDEVLEGLVGVLGPEDDPVARRGRGSREF